MIKLVFRKLLCVKKNRDIANTLNRLINDRKLLTYQQNSLCVESTDSVGKNQNKQSPHEYGGFGDYRLTAG